MLQKVKDTNVRYIPKKRTRVYERERLNSKVQPLNNIKQK